ncbi:MAG: HDOD domain-containing protein [Calditrichota bacterium]
MIQEHSVHHVLQELIEEVDRSEIASIKKIVAEIVGVINDPSSAAKHLKDIIEMDPPLASRVLHRANSAYFARSRKISDILEAIIWIGFEEVKELALSQTVSKIFEEDQTVYGYSAISLWKHSVAVAMCGKLIYRRELGQRGDNAYAAGLLHDIGIIVEEQFYHDEFHSVLKRRETDKVDMPAAESEFIGFNHAQIGAALTSHWDLPEELVTGIGGHHEPGSVSGANKKIALAIYIADQLCQSVGLGFNDTPYHGGDDLEEIADQFNLTKDGLDLIVLEMKKKIEIMEKDGWF